MANTTWAPPASPPPPAAKPRMSASRKWAIAGAVFVGLAVLGAATDKNDSGSGSGGFPVAAGWDASRAANLSVKIQTDDGVSSARADCAMKAIAYDTTWLEWQAMGSAGQFVAIRSVEAGC